MNRLLSNISEVVDLNNGDLAVDYALVLQLGSPGQVQEALDSGLLTPNRKKGRPDFVRLTREAVRQILVNEGEKIQDAEKAIRYIHRIQRILDSFFDE